MSYITILVSLFLFHSIYTLSSVPSWVSNHNIDAGEVVVANVTANLTIWNTTMVRNQHFNKTDFITPPRVILSMIGMGILTPVSPFQMLGFKMTITGVNLTHFNYTIQAYEGVVFILNYIYFAVQFETTTYFMDRQSFVFNSTSNLANNTALQRYETFILANPGGMVNTGYGSQDIQIYAFPFGYKQMAISGKSYFSINASLINQTFYAVNISTMQSNILYQLQFSVIAFNRGAITSNYSVYIDIMTTNLVGNSTTYFPPVIASNQFIFRNALNGAVDVYYITTGRDFFYYYSVSAINDFIVGRTINNRVRSCPANLSYYEPTDKLCYDQCPNYYFINTTFSLCFPCHYTCLQCSSVSLNNSCTVCSSTDFRVLTNLSCPCNIGYFDVGVSICSACNFECRTCSSSTNNSCLSCNAALFRVIDTSLQICNCMSGYFQNITCLGCQTIANGCTSCQYDKTTDNYTCLVCDPNLFIRLSNDSKTCICQNAYFLNTTSSLCQPCPTGCLSCIQSNSSSLCLNCDSSIFRTMAVDNLTCNCINGYFATTNNSCIACSISGCTNCTSQSPLYSQICLICDTASHWILHTLNCICATNYTLANNTCMLNNNSSVVNSSVCGDGILSSSEQCDDFNTVEGDGCSQLCFVETYHSCINNGSLFNYSLCYYSYTIDLVAKLIYKIPSQNSVKLELNVIAPGCNAQFLKKYLQTSMNLLLFDYTARLLIQSRYLQSTAWISIPSRTIFYDIDTGLLTIVFDYNASIDLSTKYLKFIASTSITSQQIKYFYDSPTANLGLSSPYNKLSTNYYSPNQYQTVKFINIVFIILVLLYWVFIVAASIFKRTAMAIQSMIVLQLTYFTLLDQPTVIESCSGLQINGKYTFGYNIVLQSNSFLMDLKGLQIDGNMINTLNITVGVFIGLVLAILGHRIYQFVLENRLRKQMMQINQSQQNGTVKIQKLRKLSKLDRVFSYIIDIALSLSFLTVTILTINISFTDSSTLIGNLSVAAMALAANVVLWYLSKKRSHTLVWKNTSYHLIMIDWTKVSVSKLCKTCINNYYFSIYILLALAGLLIAFLRKYGIIVFILIIFVCAVLTILHLKCKLYSQKLSTHRSIFNYFALTFNMLLHIIQYFTVQQPGIGLSIAIVIVVILFAVLAVNSAIFGVMLYRRSKFQKEEANHQIQMKEMANSLGLANMSMIEHDKSHIRANKSRDFTKINNLNLQQYDNYDSNRSQLLQKQQENLFGIIQQKIKELKEFKKTIQAQVDGASHSRSICQKDESASAGPINLQNLLDQLNKSNEFGDVSAI